MAQPAPFAATAPEFFSAIVVEYDSLIHRAVPRYDEMTQWLIDTLPARAERILELGCGTGNLTLHLARRFPRAAITTVDASQEMLDLTASRLAAEPVHARGNVRFMRSTFEQLRFDPGAFDLVASCISLHHVVDKAALFTNIRRWIAPGGALRFSDQMAGATPATHDLIWRRWLEHCRAPNQCTEEEIAGLLEHAEKHDHYTPLPTHVRMLETAGFDPASIDCVWRHLNWCVVTADAPA